MGFRLSFPLRNGAKGTVELFWKNFQKFFLVATANRHIRARARKRAEYNALRRRVEELAVPIIAAYTALFGYRR